MNTELLISSRSSGQVLEVSGCAQSITYTTNRTGSPGNLKFTLIAAENIPFSEGDPVRFAVDGTLVFYGWVFTRSVDRWGVMEVTCYDRLRYLKASASYAFYGQTAGDIIRQIAGDLQLTVGQVAETGYAIPSLIKEDKTCLDIIGDAVNQTLLNTGVVYTFFDDGDGLALQPAGSMISNILIGEGSLLTDYTYKSDIDQQTYNSVKLARPNEETGRADVFVAMDSSTISEWGMLQLYQTVDGAVNDAQVAAQAEATLAYYNRPMKTFRVSSLGVVGLRAGQMAYLQVPAVPELASGAFVLLEKVTHTFENDVHTMEFETLTL
mgnify:CR=1 FL=1